MAALVISRKFLLDSFATVITRVLNWDLGLARRYDPAAPERDILHSLADGAGAIPKRVFTQEHFDWQGDQPLIHQSTGVVLLVFAI